VVFVAAFAPDHSRRRVIVERIARTGDRGLVAWARWMPSGPGPNAT
jgi:hypothetical protein